MHSDLVWSLLQACWGWADTRDWSCCKVWMESCLSEMLWPESKGVDFGNNSIWAGIVPTKRLSCITSSSKFTRLGNPARDLVHFYMQERSNFLRLCSWISRLSRMVPFNILCRRWSSTRAVQLAMSSGIGPNKLLKDKFRICKARNLPRLGKMVPEDTCAVRLRTTTWRPLAPNRTPSQEQGDASPAFHEFVQLGPVIVRAFFKSSNACPSELNAATLVVENIASPAVRRKRRREFKTVMLTRDAMSNGKNIQIDTEVGTWGYGEVPRLQATATVTYLEHKDYKPWEKED